jgi:putative transposase
VGLGCWDEDGHRVILGEFPTKVLDERISTMADGPSIDVTEFLGMHLDSASPDLLREMVCTFAQAMIGADAEADGVCGAGYGERSEDRVNSRNGYRDRPWDTRVGSIELRVPKLRTGSYFPDWLLGRRTRAEQALISVVATAYLLGVSTRRVEGLVNTLGIEKLSKSQVSDMAKHLRRACRQRSPGGARGRWTPGPTGRCGSTPWW